jgi:hypothetical protein
MGDACSTRGRKTNYLRGFGGGTRREQCLENLGVDARIILKWDLMGGCRLNLA